MDSCNACRQVSTLLYTLVSNSFMLFFKSADSSVSFSEGEGQRLHQAGHDQKSVAWQCVALIIVYFPEGKTHLVPLVQKELSHSLWCCRKMWLTRDSALCFSAHIWKCLLVWGISFQSQDEHIVEVDFNQGLVHFCKVDSLDLVPYSRSGGTPSCWALEDLQ